MKGNESPCRWKVLTKVTQWTNIAGWKINQFSHGIYKEYHGDFSNFRHVGLPKGIHPPDNELLEAENDGEHQKFGTSPFCKEAPHVQLLLPSRKLTYPTLGKGTSSSNMPYQGDMLVPWRVCEASKPIALEFVCFLLWAKPVLKNSVKQATRVLVVCAQHSYII